MSRIGLAGSPGKSGVKVKNNSVFNELENRSRTFAKAACGDETRLGRISRGLGDFQRISLDGTMKEPLRIGILADTHLSADGEALGFLAALENTCFAGVDLILHAGDLVDPDIRHAFTRCPVLAVRGNMDPPAADLPEQRVVETGHVRIGLRHGWGAVCDLEDRLLETFRQEALDVLVYGHSHRPVCHWRNGILLFNPGSAADRRGMPYHSVGLLEIGDRIEGRIIPIDGWRS